MIEEYVAVTCPRCGAEGYDQPSAPAFGVCPECYEDDLAAELEDGLRAAGCTDAEIAAALAETQKP